MCECVCECIRGSLYVSAVCMCVCVLRCCQFEFQAPQFIRHCINEKRLFCVITCYIALVKL